MSCNEKCWFAKGNICKCSCGGKNHGIGRKPDAEDNNEEDIIFIETNKNPYRKQITMGEFLKAR